MPEWQETEETQLIARAQKGDTEAFGQLYESYAPRLFRFFYANLENRPDAEDLTEEVFFRTWKFLPNYRERGAPFGGFLFRVARNLLVDHFRGSGRVTVYERFDDILVDGSQENTEWISSELNELKLVMEDLREDYRTVLSLRFLGELTPDETAYAMGKSRGAVRVLQHRALLAARKAMQLNVKGEDETAAE